MCVCVLSICYMVLLQHDASSGTPTTTPHQYTNAADFNRMRGHVAQRGAAVLSDHLGPCQVRLPFLTGR